MEDNRRINAGSALSLWRRETACCGRSIASSRGLFQGCQIGDDVGTIFGLRQSPEKHFYAVNVAARICEIGIQCGRSPRGLVRFHRFRIGIVRHTGRLTSHDAPEARSDLVYPDFRGVAVLADVLKNGSSGNRITAGIRRKRRGRARHQQRRKNYATDHESIPFINFVSRSDAIWKYPSGGNPSAESRTASVCKSFTRGRMFLCAVVSRSAATVQRCVLEGGGEKRVMFCVTRTRTC
jgi:hypothetical protein